MHGSSFSFSSCSTKLIPVVVIPIETEKWSNQDFTDSYFHGPEAYL